MALAPKFAGQKFVAGVEPKTVHTLELYLDYVCPFSAKLFNRVHASVLPLLRTTYKNKVAIIFRQQIQPWHPSSTLVHEAGAAVLRLAPDRFWDFSAALFARQSEFFDVSVVRESRNQTYARLAKIAAESAGVEEEAFLKLLTISEQPGKDGALNSGNAVTPDIMFLVKANRLTGVHVTPTVLFNGVVENSISSGWTAEQWEEWLQKNIV
ncbi:MAG: hypothetical protein M1819_002885 [Sarea resinae]|nr:MAG: hypothetical protein M1819_002885 [Sarea resinae]